MPGFDIEKLLNFKPAQHLCEKCYALLQKVPDGTSDTPPVCPVCKVRYQPTDEYERWSLSRYLKDSGYYLPLDNPIKHARSLAAISSLFRRGRGSYPPLRGLFEALNAAQHFVHFTTYGISHLLIGALKMTSQRVPVRGIVSNVEAAIMTELSKFPNEAPQFKVKTYGTDANWSDMPHQKLVVIDGLLAFKGSGNLTLNSWRKAAKGRDLIEVATDVDEVIKLHNRFFASLWGELSDTGDVIEMLIDIPF